jgi:hypothetical protein
VSDKPDAQKGGEAEARRTLESFLEVPAVDYRRPMSSPVGVGRRLALEPPSVVGLHLDEDVESGRRAAEKARWGLTTTGAKGAQGGEWLGFSELGVSQRPWW